MSRSRSTLLLTTLTAVTALAAPCLSAHAAGTDPWVRAWGENAQGQLGNGSVLAQQTPAAVTGITRDDVRELSGGGGGAAAAANPFAVALLKDGTVKSWGNNATGQLGNGTLTAQSFPATVAGLSGVSEVSAGLNHVLAVKGGRVLAWGSNASKQLGRRGPLGCPGLRCPGLRCPGLWCPGLWCPGLWCPGSRVSGSSGVHPSAVDRRESRPAATRSRITRTSPGTAPRPPPTVPSSTGVWRWRGRRSTWRHARPGASGCSPASPPAPPRTDRRTAVPQAAASSQGRRPGPAGWLPVTAMTTE
ncbi:hypothetical protein AB0F16_31375 [Streptomyces tanashiensis]|uniref:RCC1 domain-containing protein n=1 Tax=Streptomyces tanashiensis TaxID=67367 RepID=UPI0033CFD618